MTEQFSDADRIATLAIDHGGYAAPTQKLEQDRRVAEFELLEENCFKVANLNGPYDVVIDASADKILLSIKSQSNESRVDLCTPCVRAMVADYLAVCESYEQAVPRLSPGQIAVVDQQRREAHNEGADALSAAMSDVSFADNRTAKQLFSLVVVLVQSQA